MVTKLTVIIVKLVVMILFGQSGFQSTQSSVPIPFWDLDEKQIERLHKDEEMKQRVSLSIDGPATMDGLLKYSVVRVVVHYICCFC